MGIYLLKLTSLSLATLLFTKLHSSSTLTWLFSGDIIVGAIFVWRSSQLDALCHSMPIIEINNPLGCFFFFCKKRKLYLKTLALKLKTTIELLLFTKKEEKKQTMLNKVYL